MTTPFPCDEGECFVFAMDTFNSGWRRRHVLRCFFDLQTSSSDDFDRKVGGFCLIFGRTWRSADRGRDPPVGRLRRFQTPRHEPTTSPSPFLLKISIPNQAKTDKKLENFQQSIESKRFQTFSASTGSCRSNI